MGRDIDEKSNVASEQHPTTTPLHQEVQQHEQKPPAQAQPEGRGGPPGGGGRGPGGGGFGGGGRGPGGGGEPIHNPVNPVGPGHGGGDNPPVNPVRPPVNPVGPVHGGGGDNPHPPVNPHPPINPVDPGHHPIGPGRPVDPGHGGGFQPGRPFGPPLGGGWGWQDPNRWNTGWDNWFFQQDPNFGVWQPTITGEAANITNQLFQGNATGAADELNADMFAMRGDIYAQDALLNQINVEDQGSPGAYLQLGNWDPGLGTWDNIAVIPAANDPEPAIPIQTFGPNGMFTATPFNLNLNVRF